MKLTIQDLTVAIGLRLGRQLRRRSNRICPVSAKGEAEGTKSQWITQNSNEGGDRGATTAAVLLLLLLGIDLKSSPKMFYSFKVQ